MDEGGAPESRESSADVGKRGRTMREHVRSRAPVLGTMLVCAAAATASSAPYPAKNEEGMVALLSQASGGAVAPGDFVWEPTGGFFEDLLVGRRILFLAKSGPGGLRDLYRARVTVTRQGRPMRARSVVDLSLTELADEHDLVVSDGGAAVASDASGRVQSVRYIDLHPQARTSFLERWGFGDSRATLGAALVSFSRPPKRARYEIAGGELLLSLGDEGESALLEPVALTLVSTGARYGAYAVRVGRGPAAEARAIRRVGCALELASCADEPASGPPPVAPAEVTHPEERPFPPSARFEPMPIPRWKGVVSPVFRSESGSVNLYALDMRQLRLKTELASDIPRSETGHYPRPNTLAETHSILVLAGPSDERAGAVDGGNAMAPFRFPMGTLMDGVVPRVEIGARVGPDSTTLLGFPTTPDASRRERSVLCATSSGHFFYAWGPRETPQSMGSALADIDCAAVLPIEGTYGMGMAVVDGAIDSTWSSLVSIDSAMSMQWADVGRTTSALLFQPRVDAPTAPAPRSASWEVDSAPQPEPVFAPAIYHSSTESLGAHVDLRLFMPGRFDWVLRAGEKEKTHRLGGTFVKALDNSEKTRAYFAVGLGIGKRRSPLGLRISGSTGHAFHHQGGRVEAGLGSLVVGSSSSSDPSSDASELPLMSVNGTVLPAARERGPKQKRADLCVLSDGTVLYAEADFDSHEATARVLTELGCTAIVGLDRGAEQPGWSETHDHIAPAHDATTLVALSRPTRGPVLVGP